MELTIALHRVFDSPRDVLLFDTGHQAYVHKILTGRAGAFRTLRKAEGLSGYPSRAESAHDWIENSHASTALAYADGIAKAFALAGETPRRHVVAVIGDGALTGGLAWEGLNNLAASPDRPLIVVLNDNGRSYAETAGGLARHLATIRQRSGPAGRGVPGAAQDAGDTVFGHLGLAYLGPVDGHDIGELGTALEQARALNRTVIVHAVTGKGRGYAPAERDETDRMHGIGILDPATGRPAAATSRTPPDSSWTRVFGEEVATIAAERSDVVAITAAMLHPVGLRSFAGRFPGRVFDVGIAEQLAVCSAAGLAMGGAHPVVCVYATFLNRALDQVLMDVALHRLGVTFVLDRAGITGPDGASHHGMWDIALLSAVPGLRLAAPRDPARLRELLREAITVSDAPTVIRYPKAHDGADIGAVACIDGLDVLHRSHGMPQDVLIVAIGPLAGAAMEAARLLNSRGTGVTVVDPRWVLPVHRSLPYLAARHQVTVTVEDGLRDGGFGSGLILACADADVSTPVRALGLPRAFLGAGDRADLLARHELTGSAIAAKAQDVLRRADAGLPRIPAGSRR